MTSNLENESVGQKRRIGLVLIGLGHQGQKVASKFGQIRDYVATHGIALELWGLKDLNDDNRRKAIGLLPSDVKRRLELSPELVGLGGPSILDVLRPALADRGLKRCLVYDATDSHLHFKHLRKISEVNQELADDYEIPDKFFLYLGEKPIITTSGELYSLDANEIQGALQRDAHFCNFGETKNPAFLTLVHDLQQHAVAPHRISFWRANTVAFDRLLLGGRSGVTGGSFLDKSIHDLSIVASIIHHVHPTSALRCDQLQIINANVSWLTPSLVSLPDGQPERALSLDGRPIEPSNMQAAEAAVTIDAKIDLPHSTVAIRLHSSWLGLDPTERAITENWEKELGVSLTCRGHVMPADLVPGYAIEDTRILHLEGTIEGVACDYVANFLNSSYLTHSSNLEITSSCTPVVFARRTGSGKMGRLSLRSNQYGDSIGDVFTEIVLAVAREPNAQVNGLDMRTSAIVHAWAHQIRKAIDQTVNKQGPDTLTKAGRMRMLSMLKRPHCFA